MIRNTLLLTAVIACGIPACSAPDAMREVAGPLETIAELDQGPGNVAVSKDGRVFISHHAIYKPEVKVIEVLDDGSVRPFPNRQWAATRREDGNSLTGVLGIQVDEADRVWMLDAGRPARIVVWDAGDDKLDRILALDGPAKNRGSFFNDIALDPVNGKVYVSDASAKNPAIVIVDMDSGEAYRALERHDSVSAKAISMTVDDPVLDAARGASDAKPRPPVARIGVDGITIDPEGRWVYYTSAQGDTLWRVRTSDLLNRNLDDDELGGRVERVGDRPACDGITIDNQGNVYITDITGNAIGVVDPAGDYRRLLQDSAKLSWPDSIAFGPDGYVYVVSNQLHRSAPFNRGKDYTQKPFYLTRFRALADGTVGR
jgi:sugar lactone lactonase YvrE